MSMRATVRATLARLHGRTVPGAPRWAVRTAYAITLIPLPSCAWRVLAVVGGVPLMREPAPGPDGRPPDARLYVIALSVTVEALAFLAVGLVAPWGETWPRWIPVLGGRPVPVRAAVVPAALGAAAATALWSYTCVMTALGREITGRRGFDFTHGLQTPVLWIAYAPLLLWGPLLGVLTVHYHRRRTRARAAPAALAAPAPSGPPAAALGARDSARTRPAPDGAAGGRARYRPGMSGRHIPRQVRRMALRGLAFDVAMVLLWRYAWHRPWNQSLGVGAVLAVFSVACAWVLWRWERLPEHKRRAVEEAQGRQVEELARRQAAEEARRRAGGRG